MKFSILCVVCELLIRYRNGLNLSSDPVGTIYTATDPSQTNKFIFEFGQSEAMQAGYYWSSTDAGRNGLNEPVAWSQEFDAFTPAWGFQRSFRKSISNEFDVRPVRRISAFVAQPLVTPPQAQATVSSAVIKNVE